MLIFVWLNRNVDICLPLPRRRPAAAPAGLPFSLPLPLSSSYSHFLFARSPPLYPSRPLPHPWSPPPLSSLFSPSFLLSFPSLSPATLALLPTLLAAAVSPPPPPASRLGLLILSCPSPSPTLLFPRRTVTVAATSRQHRPPPSPPNRCQSPLPWATVRCPFLSPFHFSFILLSIISLAHGLWFVECFNFGTPRLSCLLNY